MPQIDQLSAIFASQLFWLVVVFGLIYFGIGHGMLPKIQATVGERDKKIAGDLAAAGQARAAADEIEEAYRLKMEAHHAEALKLIQTARQTAAREAEANIKAADAELGGVIAAAEARIQKATQSAMAGIEEVAAEAAQQVVARLSGAKISKADAIKAVKAVSKEAARG